MNISMMTCILMLAGATQPDKGTVCNGLAARHESLQKIVARYDLERIPTPSKRSLKMDGIDFGEGGRAHIVRDSVKTHEEFWYLDGRMRHESRVSIDTQEHLRQKNSPYRPPTESINVYTRERHESLHRLTTTMTPYRGQIDNPASQLGVDLDIELSLGLRYSGGTTWLKNSDFDDAEIENTSSGDVVVSRRVGSAAHRWTYDPDLGYALKSYEAIVDDKVVWKLNNSDFRNIGGLMLPMKMENVAFEEEEGETIVVKTNRISVHEYSLNHPENTPDKYRIVWPCGAWVYDNRIGIRFEVDDAGKLHPAMRNTKEVLDNLAKPLDEWESSPDANGSSSTPETAENMAESDKQDQNGSPVDEEVSPPIAGTGDVDAGAGKTLTFVVLALFLACAVSIAVYNRKQRKKATESAP